MVPNVRSFERAVKVDGDDPPAGCGEYLDLTQHRSRVPYSRGSDEDQFAGSADGRGSHDLPVVAFDVALGIQETVEAPLPQTLRRAKSIGRPIFPCIGDEEVVAKETARDPLPGGPFHYP